MTFSPALRASSDEPVFASLAKTAVRTRFALTSFLSAGGERRLTNLRELLQQLTESAQHCGLVELASALSHCEETLSCDGELATTEMAAIDGALRTLAARAARPRLSEAPFVDDEARAAPAPHAGGAVAAALALSAEPAGATVSERAASPLEQVLLATESASFGAPADADADEPPLEIDDAPTDVDDAPVFECAEESSALAHAAPVLTLTPPSKVGCAPTRERAPSLTPPPRAVSGGEPADQVEAPPAPEPAAEIDAVTAIVTARPPSCADGPAALVSGRSAAFVSAEALERVMADPFVFAPRRSRSAIEPDSAEASAITIPFDRVHPAYLILTIVLGLLLGFVARTMLLELGALAPTHALSAVVATSAVHP